MGEISPQISWLAIISEVIGFTLNWIREMFGAPRVVRLKLGLVTLKQYRVYNFFSSRTLTKNLGNIDTLAKNAVIFID